MIRFFEEKDRTSVILLWQEAFGDSKEEICAFLNFFKNDIIVLVRDGRIVSMLTLAKTSIGADRGRYIYAVATHKEYRSMGFASALIEFAKNFIKKNDEKFLILVPQENSLFDFYRKSDFFTLCCAEKIVTRNEFKQNQSAKAEKISASEYFDLRKAYFQEERFAEWDIQTLEFMKKAYKGNFFALKEENTTLASAFCYIAKDKLIIPELLSMEKAEKCINTLSNYFGKSEIFCIKPKKNGERLAMIYPKGYKCDYFGLAMK